MSASTNWYHGTVSTISDWKIGGRGAIKGAMSLHEGLFFSSDHSFAKLSADARDGACNVYSSTLTPKAKILDLSNPGVSCLSSDSESFRDLVRNIRPGKGNIQADYKEYWEAGWKNGHMMKYAPRPHEAEEIQKLFLLAQTQRHTKEGAESYNLIQSMTRNCIEDIVQAGRKAGYQAIIGNEFQYQKTYPILIVLDASVLSPPVPI